MRLKNSPQVQKDHYSFDFYSSERRYISYFHQVKNVMYFVTHENVKNILIAGKGDGIVQKILEAYSELFGLNLSIKTFDIAADLHPDILGDLVDIKKLVNTQVDIILCCQTLEHLPLKESLHVLEQMGDISKYVIISVPYKSITFRACLKVPLLNEFEILIKIPIWKNKKGMVDSRHYWEIGYGISIKKFNEALIRLGYKIISAYVIKKDGFKQFFVLESAQK